MINADKGFHNNRQERKVRQGRKEREYYKLFRADIAILCELLISGTFILRFELLDYIREKLFVRRPASYRKNNSLDRVYTKQSRCKRTQTSISGKDGVTGRALFINKKIVRDRPLLYYKLEEPIFRARSKWN